MLGGEDLEPFYGLLCGGKEGELIREIENFFYYAQIRSQGEDTMEFRDASDFVDLEQIPFLMRALGFYPTEQEVRGGADVCVLLGFECWVLITFPMWQVLMCIFM